ncbi:MAG TPA: PfkB family carbohydrate kinase [Streptosporangiaceae bacterium]
MASPPAAPRALFAGLCTFDLIQSVDRIPGQNEKVTALDQAVAAGGPATNASVAFAFLGGHATLVTGIGRHALAQGIRADLAETHVEVIDVAEADDTPPAVSSILVTQGSGDRRVVSLNATGRMLEPPASLDSLAGQAAAILIDGHHPMLAITAARAARQLGRPCVLDGGSWKSNTADLLPYVDIAICSADFHPPGTNSSGTILDYLLDHGIRWAAVTDGARPIAWAGTGPHHKRSEIPVPAVTVADTLGAGDVFHGAFTYAIARADSVSEASFGAALSFAADVAAHSCRTFGTRTWMRSR